MSKICQITGKKMMVGNKISNSNIKTKRLFNINFFKKKFFIPSKKKWIKLKVSSHGIRIINKIGIEKALKYYYKKNFYEKKKKIKKK
ncbi:50S ribosomal protein L28 [Candidatus Shikimatogenerans silvanidophilus]|uniref:50S ribosomal protein L28 n=1 Tax=Candidatus Shikimatogenerans silvanidophilus TaxID=2782547 RepID=UPI001BA99977|nr:50S ribosomal protein L28 [Candidatus Shikimatogenerans silvanidophilus]